MSVLIPNPCFTVNFANGCSSESSFFLPDLEHIEGLGCRAVLFSATITIDQKASCGFSFGKEGLVFVLNSGFRSVTVIIKVAGSSACFHYNQTGTGQKTNRATRKI